ncbi:LPS export ABC transporter periplasmic protein LptC [Bacteroidota bacterium]
MRRQLFILISIIFAGMTFSACENDIEKINLFTGNSGEYPDVVGEDIEVMYSDSGKVKVQLHSKELNQFNKADKPYSEFPQGLIVYFYDDSLNIESEISADYAIYDNEEKLWHAKGNVIAKNLKNGYRLDSEEMFWDEEKEEIYSTTFTKIVNENGTFYGQEGFKSNQTFTKYQLIGVTNSEFNIEDE